MSAFGRVEDIGPQRIWGGVVARAIGAERVTLCTVELDPDIDVPEHRHENEQVGMLVEGSMTFRVGDETLELVPGATWRIPPNVPHQVTTGPDGAVAVEVFAPRRTDWDAVEPGHPDRPVWP